MDRAQRLRRRPALVAEMDLVVLRLAGPVSPAQSPWTRHGELNRCCGWNREKESGLRKVARLPQLTHDVVEMPVQQDRIHQVGGC